MYKKLIVLTLCILFFFGCASPLRKACNELSNTANKLNTAIRIATIIHQDDPSLISIEQIDELVVMRDSIACMAVTACMLKDGLAK